MTKGKDVDDALSIVVNIVNGIDDSPTEGPGLVLTLGCGIISGELIPNWLWFREVQEEIRRARMGVEGLEEGEEVKGWETFFKQIHDQIVADRDEIAATIGVVDRLPERYQTAVAQVDETVYIHLRNARVYSPGQSPTPANGMYWRGRLSEVSGWSFGSLGAAKNV